MTTPAPIPQLYSHPESGNGYKIRLFASLIDIKLEVIDVDLMKRENQNPKFLSINPRGTLPALVDGPLTLTDSAAILVYLAGKYIDNKSDSQTYWSEDTTEQAQIIDWLAFASNWIHLGLGKARLFVSFRKPGLEVTQKDMHEATTRGTRALEILEEKLRGEEWIVLGRPTVADIAIFPYVALAPMGDILLEPFENVRRWMERVKSLHGFITMVGMDDPKYRRQG